MTRVVISIHPKWCEKILNGEKTVEIRKKRPNKHVPFKVYIYCTQAKYPHEDFIAMFDGTGGFYGGGKIIAEFMCDKIDFTYLSTCCKGACMSAEEIDAYAGWEGVPIRDRKGLYMWHISDLKIYDTPKDIVELGLKRPPQSWCYAEETEE